MKKIKYLQILFLSTILLHCFTACSKDEDVSPIIGSWRCNIHYYSGPDTYTFNSDGTYYWECPGFHGSSDRGVYTYNERTCIFTRVNENGTSWLEMIVFVSSNTFILTDESGDSYTYERVK